MHPKLVRFTPEERERLSVLFLAKHALSGGRPHAEDGSHAVYHHELLTSLQATGLKVLAADTYEVLLGPPPVDFVVPLLNRGGFLNSEMLAPTLLERARVPYLGATPILRGLSDDKHLMKTVAAHRGVPTAPWRILRRGGWGEEPVPDWGASIVKPNASSASWGIKRLESGAEVMRHVAQLHAERHDAIVEPWLGDLDIAVPVIGGAEPWLLPPFAYNPGGTGGLRSYEEKRNLVPTDSDDPLEPVEDPALRARIEELTRRLIPELWPFDYGRFEFRYDRASGDLLFMEVNLSCNLWSKKTISRSARTQGISHDELVEHILASSMARQGVIQRAQPQRAAA